MYTPQCINTRNNNAKNGFGKLSLRQIIWQTTKIVKQIFQQ